MIEKKSSRAPCEAVLSPDGLCAPTAGAVTRSASNKQRRLSCYLRGMNGQEILAQLRENETALRARGVSHAALFGSRARGDNRPDSDIDIMVEFDPAAHVTVFYRIEIIASLNLATGNATFDP
jgi:predicted nucleotidyltransferase